MPNDRAVQALDFSGSPGAYDAASAGEFHLGAFTDLLAAVLFKVGPNGVPGNATWATQELWGNFDPFNGTGWGFELADNGAGGLALRAVISGSGNPVTLSYGAIPIGGPVLPALVDRLILAAMHYNSTSQQLDLYVQGNRVVADAGILYTPSALAARIGADASNIAQNNAKVEIVGAAFSRLNAPPDSAYMQGLMLQAYRQCVENNQIGMLDAKGNYGWDHRYNTLVGGQSPAPTLVQGVNGGYVYPANPPAQTQILDTGNTGALAAPSNPAKIPLNAVGSALSVVTTRNPGWYSGLAPIPGQQPPPN